MNTKPIVADDGFLIAKITHSMGGATYPLALVRYGRRYFLRDVGPPEQGSRCSFSVPCDDLRTMLDQADEDNGSFGDVLHMTIGMEYGGRLAFDPEDDDDDDDEEHDPGCDTSEEPRVTARIQRLLEDYL